MTDGSGASRQLGMPPARAAEPPAMAGRPGRTAVATPPARPPGPPATRGPRRARLTVKRVDPWSVLKFSFVFSVAILVVWIVAVAVLYSVLDGMGVFDKINKVLADFSTKDGVPQWQITLTSSRVVGWAALIGAVNAVLFTALTTLGAFIYNLCSSLSGGVELTLTERD
jgi:hypothetical protein